METQETSCSRKTTNGKTSSPEQAAAARLLRRLKPKPQQLQPEQLLDCIAFLNDVWVNVYSSTSREHVIFRCLDQDCFEKELKLPIHISWLPPALRQNLGY
jgi:hypothetical protein